MFCVLKRAEFSQTHEVAGASAESDPWCLETPRLSEISHLIPCHGHSRCTFHAACTARSCTAHAHDFDARALLLSWPSDQDNPHEYPLDYHMIRMLGILNWAYRRNERPDLIFSVPRRARHQKRADHGCRRPYTLSMRMKLGTHMRIICIYLYSI